MKSRRLLAPALLLTLAGMVACAEGNGEIPGPAVGDTFPHALEAADQNGTMRSLAGLYGENGVAVLFVRSADWCPFCREQLADVNARLPEFQALGLNAVSISVDDVAMLHTFAEAADIGYTMLADPNGDINESLGIRDPQYPVGSAQFGVPRPTLYLIDTSGTIRARFMEPTFRTRPDLDIVLAEAEALDL
jgi:peroxiredoxin